MDLVDKILSDKEVVALFLSYMKQHLRQQDMPEAIPQQAKEEETTDFLKQVWDFNKSVETLTNALEVKFGIAKDLDAPESQMNKVIIEVCGKLQEQYSEDDIRQYSPSASSRH